MWDLCTRSKVDVEPPVQVLTTSNPTRGGQKGVTSHGTDATPTTATKKPAKLLGSVRSSTEKGEGGEGKVTRDDIRDMATRRQTMMEAVAGSIDSMPERFAAALGAGNVLARKEEGRGGSASVVERTRCRMELTNMIFKVEDRIKAGQTSPRTGEAEIAELQELKKGLM